jgi:hypothetical protein
MRQTAKQLLLLALFSILTSFCLAQIPIPTGGGGTPPPPPPPPRIKPLSLTIKGNHDFYLMVNNEKYGRVTKDVMKTVKLKPGLHKLSFEEADSTGEVIERHFKVTQQMAKQGDSTYFVEFKKDFLEIMRSYPAVLPNQSKQQQ